jgi:Amt family ammonium transporter
MIAGTSALVYCLVLGKRQPVTRAEQNHPYNINNIFIGTVLSWFGWFGFNGGRGLIISSRAALACMVTNLAACTGGFTWCMLDYFLLEPRYKFTLFGFCMGSMAGLVSAPSSLVFGIGGSAYVYFGRQIKIFCKIDDAFDIFAQHGIEGFVGSLLTGIFAQQYIPALDQVSIPGGWLDGNWIQLTYQLVLSGKNYSLNFDLKIYFLAAGFVWSFVVTLIILLIMNKIPGLALRTSTDGEIHGIDHDQFNEFIHDYIEFQRDLYDTISKPTSMTKNAW